MVAGWLSVMPALLCGFPEQTKDRSSNSLAEKENPPTQKTPLLRKTGRAFLESALLLAGSTTDYWRTYHDFKEDWQFRFTWKDQRRRFFTSESPKFDSNSFWFNYSHALAGAYYYSCARTNGLNSLVSSLFTLGMSTFWECVSEWREVISVNDMIMTPFGGPNVGEPLFQLSSYFSHRKGLLNRVMSFIFSPFLVANNWFDRRSGPTANSVPDASWHRFRLFAGPRNGSYSPAGTHYRQFNLGFEMETITVPGYGEARTFRRTQFDTLSSSIFIDFSLSSAGQEEFNIRTQAVLFGYTWQSLPKGGDGSSCGMSGSLGAGCAFDIYKKRPLAWYDGSAQVPGGGPALSDARFRRPTPTEFTDKMAAISLVGPVLDLSGFAPRLQVRWMTKAFFDFAMVNALAYNRFTEKYDNSGVKTTLLNWGYYYAWGTTLASDLAADWRQWRLRGYIGFQSYDSIQGQDRFQFLGVVTDDFKLHDTRLVWRFKLGYALPRTPVELALAAEGIGRRGNILEVHERYQESRIYYQVGVLF